MARRSSTAEDILSTSSRLPSWSGVALAVIVFVALRLLSGIDVPQTAAPDAIAGAIALQFVKSLSGFGQWVLPPLLLAGALISFLKRRKRNALHDHVSARASRDALDEMSWQAFETLVGECFRRRGYTVIETGGGGADDGVDLVLTREGGRYLVQCEQKRSWQVGLSVVRELYGVTAARRATGCFVVTSGHFTDEARRFAAPLKIGLIDGARLARAIAQPPKSEVALQPSRRREPRGIDEQWAANAAEIERRRSIDIGTPDELDELATRRLRHEDAAHGEARTRSAWFTAVAGGLCVGGLLFYLFVTLSEIGPPKETREIDVRSKAAPVDAARESSRSGIAAQTKVHDRRPEAEKRAAEERALAAMHQAQMNVGNALADRKDRAWQQFYRPSEACGPYENRGTITCANEYARAKMEFEKRWSEGQL
jgi:restriction system protein